MYYHIILRFERQKVYAQINHFEFHNRKRFWGIALAPLQVFNALLHSAFQAASKLRTIVHDIRRLIFFIT